MTFPKGEARRSGEALSACPVAGDRKGAPLLSKPIIVHVRRSRRRKAYPGARELKPHAPRNSPQGTCGSGTQHVIELICYRSKTSTKRGLQMHLFNPMHRRKIYQSVNNAIRYIGIGADKREGQAVRLDAAIAPGSDVNAMLT